MCCPPAVDRAAGRRTAPPSPSRPATWNTSSSDRHAVVVVGARLDHHFFERRDLLVAAGPQDAHVGRAIVQHADEVFGVALVRQAVDVVERDAIRTVLRDRQSRRQHLVAPLPSGSCCHRPASAAPRATGLSVVIVSSHLRAGRREDVAADPRRCAARARGPRDSRSARRSASTRTGRITSMAYSSERAEPAATEVRERHRDVVRA